MEPVRDFFKARVHPTSSMLVHPPSPTQALHPPPLLPHQVLSPPAKFQGMGGTGSGGDGTEGPHDSVRWNRGSGPLGGGGGGVEVTGDQPGALTGRVVHGAVGERDGTIGMTDQGLLAAVGGTVSVMHKGRLRRGKVIHRFQNGAGPAAVKIQLEGVDG